MSAADEVVKSADSKMTSPEPGLWRQVMSYSEGHHAGQAQDGAGMGRRGAQPSP